MLCLNIYGLQFSWVIELYKLWNEEFGVQICIDMQKFMNNKYVWIFKGNVWCTNICWYAEIHE